MITNQELNKKVRALTGETTPCDVNGNPCRDYAGDMSEAMLLLDEMIAGNCAVTIEDGLIDFGKHYFSRDISTDTTAERVICLAYIAWKEQQTA